MSTIIEESEAPITNDEIAQLENRLSIKLPADYRDFLLRHNGGRPIPNVFSFRAFHSTTNDTVAWFLCIKSDDIYDVSETVSALEERIPSNLLPIAADPFGNYICVNVAGDVGKVVLWDHELESQENNIYYLADSFSGFLNSLHEFED